MYLVIKYINIKSNVININIPRKRHTHIKIIGDMFSNYIRYNIKETVCIDTSNHEYWQVIGRPIIA